MKSQRLQIMENRVGPEKPDPTPVELPVGKTVPLTLREEMMRFIRNEISQQAIQAQTESFEDFDDLDVDDEEPDLTSPYTVTELRDEEGAYLLEPTEPEESSPEPDTPSPSPPGESSFEGSEEPSDNARAPAGLTNNASER